MKKPRLSILLGLLMELISVSGQAQDVAYFANDGSFVSNTRLTDIVNDKLILTVLREGITRNYTFSRSRIALVFTKTGNYLFVAELDNDPTQARRQIQDLLTAPPRSSDRDFLIKTNPLTVIAAQVAYESDGVVNYVTLAGNAASIGTHELTAILFRDGRHRLIAPVATAGPALASIRTQLTHSTFADEPATQPTPASTHTRIAQPVTDPDSPTDTAEAVSASVITSTASMVSPGDDRLLSVDDRAVYRKRALTRVDEFASYVNVIADRRMSEEQRDGAIEAAALLFMPESTVEVTSAHRSGSRRFSVRQYLTRLKLMPYQSTHIKWVQTQFVRDLVQNPDGTYSGTIAGQQSFSGYDTNGKTSYTDLTPKNVTISLDHYQRSLPEPKHGVWRVLLGNIRVEVD